MYMYVREILNMKKKNSLHVIEVFFPFPFISEWTIKASGAHISDVPDICFRTSIFFFHVLHNILTNQEVYL